jgi:hypothetical protein
MDTAGLIGNALPFASSGDARLKITGSTLGTSAGGKGFDGATNFITNNLWARSDAAIIASGLDARLIEAEVKLKAADYAGMMTILNGLRTAPPKLTATNVTTAFTPTAMAAIATTPATASDAAKLFFREKAFWTFSAISNTRSTSISFSGCLSGCCLSACLGLCMCFSGFTCDGCSLSCSDDHEIKMLDVTANWINLNVTRCY